MSTTVVSTQAGKSTAITYRGVVQALVTGNPGTTSLQSGTVIAPVGGGGGGAAGYLHTQASAASTWVVNHNLGYKPVVSVYSVGTLIAVVPSVTG